MKPTKKCSEISRSARRKLIVHITSGVTLVVLAITSIVIEPIILIAKYKMRIAPGTSMYDLLTGEITGAYIESYLFNITNPEDFLSGRDRQLRVQEVGPFTYQEKRINEKFELNEELQELRYSPFINATYVPELSIADPTTVNVTMANTIFLAISTAMSSYPFWSQLGLNMLTKQFNTKAILTMPVNDFLWGYNEPLLAFGNTIMPGWINFKKMGFLDRLYDKTRPYNVEISVNTADKFKIKRVNGLGGLPIWGYENSSSRSRCNSFEDVYEGVSYPPGLTPTTPVRLYRDVFCRIVDLNYIETKSLDYGPEAYLYKMNNHTYNINPDNDCLCSELGCFDGMSDISPCFYGLPFMLSNGHFYGADPKLYERIEGIAPVEEKHGGEFMIDSKLGMCLMTRISFQLNLPVKDVSFIKEARPFSNITVPVAYFRVIQPELRDEMKTLFWYLYVPGYYVMLAVEITLLATGLCLLANATRTVFCNWYSKETQINFQLETTKTATIPKCEIPLIDDKHRLRQIIPIEDHVSY